MKVRWKYNRFGHVEVWDDESNSKEESDLYLQSEDDVKTFFDHIGIKEDEVTVDDWDFAEIEQEWFGDEYMKKKEVAK